MRQCTYNFRFVYFLSHTLNAPSLFPLFQRAISFSTFFNLQSSLIQWAMIDNVQCTYNFKVCLSFALFASVLSLLLSQPLLYADAQRVMSWRCSCNLKGLCHQMNNFYEGLKNQSSTFCICADSFYIFFCPVIEKIKDEVMACLYENTTKIHPVTLFKLLVAAYRNQLMIL